MGLESALWEATRPAFRVRYIHDPSGQPRVPLYASYGSANGKTARAKLARIVRRAPEVLVKVTGRQKGVAMSKRILTISDEKAASKSKAAMGKS